MGAESFLDAPNEGKRKTKRARVLLAVKLRTDMGEIDGRLRDLSRKGALVECSAVPRAGSEVMFMRGPTCVPARVAWAAANRVGLEFAFMIDESEMLVQLGRPAGSEPSPADYGLSRYRRPRLFGEGMSEKDRNIARAWGRQVGINIAG
jgi:hypothetical protein